jgi:glucose/arabinose dehydrogenase
VRRLRRPTAWAVGIVTAAVLAGCSQGGNETVVRTESPSASPTETGEPSATTSSSTDPSESASTSEPSPAQPTVVETIASGLEVPWGLDFFPNGDAIVTERDSARVLRISGPDHAVAEVGTIGEAAPAGEGGLLGVAISPDFDKNRTLYFYVSGESDNRIVTAKLENGKLGKTTPIFTGIPLGEIHDGGRLAFGPDGFLYASTGETGNADLAQDLKSLGGKILRLTPGGKPAPGNPLNTAVWSFGHRNVQGLAWVDDQLWASEFGQNTFDELNRIEAGANYGWPEVEGRGGEEQGFIDPQAVWGTDVASPSGLAYVDGSLWMAALRGSRLWRIPVEDDEAAQPEAYFVGEYGRMRTVAVTPDGDLWLTTSNRDGRGDPAAEDDRILLVSTGG